MKLSLTAKFSATVLGVVVLAIVSSVMTLYGAWRIDKRLSEAGRETQTGVRAEEVEIAFFRENNLLASYLIEKGGQDNKLASAGKQKIDWDKEFRALQSLVSNWIATVHNTTQVSDHEEKDLKDLVKVWSELDARREEVIALANRGELDRAKAILLNEVDGRLSGEVHRLCHSLIVANEEQSNNAMRIAARRIEFTTWVVGVSGAATLLLGGFLLWLLFYRVLIPLRGMVADANIFHGNRHDPSQGSTEDEMRLMGDHLRNLMSSVSDARSRLEQSRSRLLAAEKLASVGKLAASVAHEIRNPLTAMKMWLFSVQEAVRGNADVVRRLGIVSEEIARLECIVRDFLEFSRPAAPQRQPHQIAEIVDTTLELLAPRLERGKVCVAWSPPPALPRVAVDSGQIKQVLLNLLGNAADAMPGGGEIRLAAAAEKNADGQARVVVRVRDTGPGIPADLQCRIFEPFFSTKDDGTGLGLCIAAQVMAGHGGRLVLESTTEKGTTFAVWMPIAPEDTHAQDSRS